MNKSKKKKINFIRPLTLVFVRHGESEANIVQLADKAGDSSGYTEEFRKIANSEVKLTTRGIEQAKAAGLWIKENINGGVFDEYYVSSFRRARETASHLELPQGEDSGIWKIRDYLREQSWGYFDNLPAKERQQRFGEFMATKDRDGHYWSALGGESDADLEFRAKLGIVATMYREAGGGSAIAVSHGKTLWMIRVVMEGLTDKQYHRLDSKENPLEKMNNCQVLQYTRIDPSDPTHITPNFSWMRTVCPWDTSLSKNEWVEIKRPKYTNAQLLEI